MYIVIEVERSEGKEKVSTRVVLEGDEAIPERIGDLREVLIRASAGLPKFIAQVPVGHMAPPKRVRGGG